MQIAMKAAETNQTRVQVTDKDVRAQLVLIEYVVCAYGKEH